MKNQLQLGRYKSLVDFIQKKFKEEINIADVEAITYYSYRNINRIFQAIHHETIGHYIKRLRLEKSAEYLKYSDISITDIAFEVGYSDLAAFSKAFKNKFNCSPASFRTTQDLQQEITQKAIYDSTTDMVPKLNFEIEKLPPLEILYLEYRGSYENISGIKKTWEQLVDYTLTHNLLSDQSIFLAEVLDDNEITDTINCRYNTAILLENPIDYELKGLFKTKTIESQKYVKFIHRGSHELSFETYNTIYAQWIAHIPHELVDKPILEFFLNDESDTPEKDLLTEIYIPVK